MPAIGFSRVAVGRTQLALIACTDTNLIFGQTNTSAVLACYSRLISRLRLVSAHFLLFEDQHRL